MHTGTRGKVGDDRADQGLYIISLDTFVQQLLVLLQ